jgi:hypothetical protein
VCACVCAPVAFARILGAGRPLLRICAVRVRAQWLRVGSGRSADMHACMHATLPCVTDACVCAPPLARQRPAFGALHGRVLSCVCARVCVWAASVHSNCLDAERGQAATLALANVRWLPLRTVALATGQLHSAQLLGLAESATVCGLRLYPFPGFPLNSLRTGPTQRRLRCIVMTVFAGSDCSPYVGFRGGSRSGEGALHVCGRRAAGGTCQGVGLGLPLLGPPCRSAASTIIQSVRCWARYGHFALSREFLLLFCLPELRFCARES